MKEDVFLISNGKLFRENNTLIFVSPDNKIVFPVERVKSINVIGKCSMSSMIISYLMRKNIPVNFFDSHGKYEGSLFPRKFNYPGKVIVSQAKAFFERRDEIAKEMVEGIKHNAGRIVGKSTFKDIEVPENGINNIRATEAEIWKRFYPEFGKTLKNFKFSIRTRNPPRDEVNAMISFLNAILYSIVLSEVHGSYLSPEISFLHEPMDRRFSLPLDIADIFKPLFVFKTIREIINKGNITRSDFRFENGSCLLNQDGKRKVVAAFDRRMKEIIMNKYLMRKTSMRYLIRQECHKLVRDFMVEGKYYAFRIWWF